MCLRYQFCTHQRVCILHFLKKSQIRCTLMYIGEIFSHKGCGCASLYCGSGSSFSLRCGSGSGSCPSWKWCKSSTKGLQTLQGFILSLQAFTVSVHGPPRFYFGSLKLQNFTLMRIRIRIELFTQMRIRIELFTQMRIHRSNGPIGSATLPTPIPPPRLRS